MFLRCRYKAIQAGSDNNIHHFLPSGFFFFTGMEQFSMITSIC